MCHVSGVQYVQKVFHPLDLDEEFLRKNLVEGEPYLE
jgi:hypothetical protein